MAFVLNSEITIGKFTGVKPHELKITRSILDYVDKATIKPPISARIKTRNGEVVTGSTETAKEFNEGDAVLIQLGYNGSLKTEFEGFISRINFTQPLEVECEGYSYKLRENTYLKTFVKTELIDVLKYLVFNTGIELDEKNIPSFVIDKLVLENHSGTEALDAIKKISDNTIRMYFIGKTLYAGLLFTRGRFDVKYRLGYNIIKSNDLKLRRAKNQDVVVHYVGEKKDGSKVKVQVNGKQKSKAAVKTNAKSGTTGEEQVIKTHAVTDETTLQAMAEAKHSQLSYDGYEGKITSYLQPYCEPGCRAILEDTRYPERSGNYLVESTEVSYGMNGARRVIGIGIRL